MSSNIEMDNIACLYMQDNQEWVKEGIGLVSCEIGPNKNSTLLTVKDYDNLDRTLLQAQLSSISHIVVETTTEMKNKSSTLTWTDALTNHTYSLSFKKESFRDLILNQLKNGFKCNYQNFNQFEIDDEDDDGFAVPDPHPETLSNIYGILCCIPEHSKQFVLDLLIDENGRYLRLLVGLLEPLEQKNDIERLNVLAKIMKTIFLFNNPQIVMLLFSKEIYFLFIGILEYNPSNPIKQNYREYLNSQTKYIPFINADNNLLDIIHQTYHIQYFLEIILPTIPMDEKYSEINKLYKNNINVIVVSIYTTESYIQTIRDALEESTISQNTMNCLNFINQLFILSRYRECVYYRCEFVRTILTVIPSFFDLLHKLYIMKPSLVKRKQLILSIVDNFIGGSPSDKLKLVPSIVPVSCAIVPNINPFSISFPASPYKSFLYDIIKSFWMSKELEIKEYCYNIIKEITHLFLLEDSQVHSMFIQLFYSDYINYLSLPILQNKYYDICPMKEMSLLFYIKLLSHFVFNNSTQMAYYLPLNDLLCKLISIPKKGTETSIAILQLIKNLLVSREEIYVDCIVKDNNVLKYICQLYVENCKECNLICSSVLDLFNFIINNNLTDIINSLMDNYSNELQSIPHIYQEFQNKCNYNETSKKRQRDGESPNQINGKCPKKISV